MSLFVGIDGGQSSTVALLADEQGRILGRGIAGASDEVGQEKGSRRLADALEGAVRGALASAALDARAELDAVVAGISGYAGRIRTTAPQLRAHRVRYLPDTAIAHAGAFALGSGIAIIAGTGSVAYAWNEVTDPVQIGGLGYLFGDEGSAFWIARRALSDALRAEDRATPSAIGTAAGREFGVANLREVIRAFYAGSLDRTRIAAFAPTVLGLAWRNDERARATITDAVAALAELARAAAARLTARTAPIPVALVGGLFEDARFRAEVAAAIAAGVPQAAVVASQYPPAAGALLLAYKEAGVAIPRLTAMDKG